MRAKWDALDQKAYKVYIPQMEMVVMINSADPGPWFSVYKKSGPKRPDSHHPTTSYTGARVLIYSERSHCQADWIVLSSCPLISFPGEKSIWETQLPSKGCLENTESELGELDYPGNIIMKIQQTHESPSFSTGIDLSSKLDILPTYCRKLLRKISFCAYFFR